MGKNISLIFSLLIIFSLYSCSNETSFEQKASSLPKDVKNEMSKLPDEVLEEILIPSKLPSDSYTVDFGFTSEPINDPDGEIISTTLIFIAENGDWNLIINTWHSNATAANKKSSETIKLDNGTKAEYSESKDGRGKSVTWNMGKKAKYEVTLLSMNGKYTKENLIEVVNSVK